MNFLGIDPDTKATGVAVVSDRGEVVHAEVVRSAGRLADDRVVEMSKNLLERLDELLILYRPSAVAIEWQAIRPGDKRPNDILNLAVVSGMALTALHGSEGLRELCNILRPTAQEWKGTLRKDVCTARLIEHYGLDQEGSDNWRALREITPMLRTHAIDAIGLAGWAHQGCLPWQTPEAKARRIIAAPKGLRLKTLGDIAKAAADQLRRDEIRMREGR